MAAAAAAVVPSSTVVLLLGQLPDDPLQLLAGLLLVLQELLHPFVLLWVVGKEKDVEGALQWMMDGSVYWR